VNFSIVIPLGLSPGRDDSPMPVTRVTGRRSVVNPKSRRDDSKGPHICYRPCRDFGTITHPIRRLSADGKEPPSLRD